jgi:hypothetical protein
MSSEIIITMMFQYNLKIYFLLWPLFPTCTLCCGFYLLLLRSLLEFVVIWMFLSSFSDIYYSPVGLGFGSLWKLYVIYEMVMLQWFLIFLQWFLFTSSMGGCISTLTLISFYVSYHGVEWNLISIMFTFQLFSSPMEY